MNIGFFADMIAHATDEARTFEHAQRALWRGTIIRRYLFGISPFGAGFL